MFGLHRAGKFLYRFLNYRRAEEDLHLEVQSFFEISVEREMTKGLSRKEAERIVRMQLDGPEQVKYTVRHLRTGAKLEALLQDILYALMTLTRRPAYAITAICTPALGIGANAVIFSLVSGVLLRPLPFSNPGCLVQLNESDPTNGRTAVSYNDLQQWRRQSSSFEAMIAYGNVSKDLWNAGEPERIPAVWAERGIFRILGTEPLLGRTFSDHDPLNVVVMSASLWKSRFGSDTSLVGRTVILDGQSYTVIGVMPETFQFPYGNSRTLVWMPWEVPPQYAQNRSYRVDFVVGRLKDGASAQTARNELKVISERLEADYPETNRGRRAVVTPLSEVVTGQIRSALLTLLGAVGMVLLIACANVTNLLLARMAGRRQEIAIRSALGAGISQLVQQILAESIVVSIAGGVVGLLIAVVSLPLVLKIASAHIPGSWGIGLDWRVFCFLSLISIGAGIVLGLPLALSLARRDVQAGLNEAQGSRSVGYGSSKWTGRRLRDGLVVAQIAMAFILLIGAGLLSKTFITLQSTPAGLNTTNVLTLHMSVAVREYSPRGSFDRYLRELEQRVIPIPEVRAVGFVQYLPLQNWGWTGSFSILGHSRQPATQQEPRAELRYVHGSYFRALGIPLKYGRLFNNRDTSNSQPVIVINEALARRYFPNEDPIGQRTDRGSIIGVVGDVRQSGLDQPATPEIYYPFSQNAAARSDTGVAMVVSTFSRPEAVAATVRDAVHSVNPHQALFDIKPMDKVIAESLSDLTLYIWLIAVFAGIALTVAIAGIYGVVSYAVAARMQEFAVRLALGADRKGLFRLVLRHALMLVMSGLVLGLAGSLALTQSLRSFVKNVTSLDLMLFVLISCLLAVAALTACFAPAWRAARVDPIVALKNE